MISPNVYSSLTPRQNWPTSRFSKWAVIELKYFEISFNSPFLNIATFTQISVYSIYSNLDESRSDSWEYELVKGRVLTCGDLNAQKENRVTGSAIDFRVRISDWKSSSNRISS